MKQTDSALAREAIQLLLENTKTATARKLYKRVRPGQDGRIRSKISPVGTETGRLSSGEDKWWPEPTCLTGDAEVLTHEGWQRLEDLEGDSVTVMQWWPDGSLNWSPQCPITRADWDAPVLKADSWFHKLIYTPNHRIPYMHMSRDKMLESPSEKVSTQTVRLPVSGRYMSGDIETNPTENLARMVACVQADGRITPDKAISFGFTKKRKQERLEWLLQELGWEYSTSTPTCRPEQKHYYIGVKYAQPFVDAFFPGEKRIPADYLSWSYESLVALLDETRYWDATIRGDSFLYFSIHKENVDRLCTIAHLVGVSASSRVCENRNKGSYGEHSAKPLYTANIKPRSHICSAPKHWSWMHYTGKVYCVTTESSYFLVRRRGQILVTGNSNLQNLPKKMAALDPLYEVRNTIVASPGYTFLELDLSQAESFVTAAYAGDEDKIQRMADPNNDEHALLASRIFGLPLDQIDKKTHRQLGKMGNHALNYGSGWRTFMEGVNKDYDLTGITIDARMAKQVIGAWKEINAKTVAWWAQVEREVRLNGFLVNALGRKRIFLGGVRGGGKDIIAYLPQSTIADFLNMLLVEAHAQEDGRYRVVHQIHDAILLEARQECWYPVTKKIKRLMERPLLVNGYELHIPVDVEQGRVWGKMEGVGV